VKTITVIMLLATVGLWAQTPPTGPAAPPIPIVGQPRRAASTLAAATTNSSPSRAAAPASAIPGGSASGTRPGAAALSTDPAVPAPGDIAITSAHPMTNTAPEEMLPKGMIDFRGADVNQVLEMYSMMVNRTILRPANLAGAPITLKTQGDLTMKEGIQAIRSVLAMSGIALIDFGDKFVKVVPQPEAPTAGQQFDTTPAGDLPLIGNFVTRQVQLKYAKPSEMVPILQTFAKLGNSIFPIEGSQMLVLRDNVENIQMMLKIIEELDISVPAEYTNKVIFIKYGLASDIASALNSLSSGGGSTTIGSGSRAGLTTSSTRSTSTLSRGMGGTSGLGTVPGMASPYGTTTPTAPGAAAPAASSLTERLRSIVSPAGGGASGDIQVIGKTKILADERSNSLLVFATREDMATIEHIISQLDVVLPQVMIEAVIIQVSLGNSRSLGVSYLEKQPHGFASYFAGQGAINNGTFLSPNNFLSGVSNSVASVPGGFSYLAGFGQDLNVTLTALASDNRARVLQCPRVQTSNAKQAHLFVGESRPYPTGSYYGGGSYGGYSSIQQMPIGVSIDVTPLINVEGLVVMDINARIDSVAGTVDIANVGSVPITSSKEAQSSVAVRDRDTIMLGGLIENDSSSTGSGVPFLKDIPLLGYLFRNSTRNQTRNEMILLIRPTVLPTPEIAAQNTAAEKARLPGVRQAEREMQLDEAKRIDKANRELDHLDNNK
jgi:general secretion pathway protein D